MQEHRAAAMIQAQSDGESNWVGRLDVQTALDRLEPKYKQVIILKYYEDMTLTEIAEATGKPLGTVKTWLHKALTQLRPLMNAGEEGVQNGAGYEGTH